MGAHSPVDELFSHAPVSNRLAPLYGLGKLGVRFLPLVDGINVNAEVLSQVKVNGADTAQLFGLTNKLRLITRRASSTCDD
ncbi:hypothetical protein FJ943_15515 [Mesorhizobium sp. B2-3-10]|nr:hypothetical protein FJ943_15515 [Mesorhizobium sp. B2-3-10]